MGIQLTSDQIVTMAPDSSSAAAGKKLSGIKNWKNLGQNAEALWGECQGSALYQVRVDLSTLTIQCSCPSRKQPCKHGLGLLLLTVNTASAVPVTEPPEWVVAWLAKRAAASKRKETIEKRTETSTPSATQAKTVEKRLAQVRQGLDLLDLWLGDLVRNGLASVETQPFKFWEEQKKRMVDAQAPGIATRISRMATIPNASPDWPTKLLGQLGQLALITHAFRRIDQLESSLQEDVRLMIGWTLKEDEVITRGEKATDDWFIVGQIVEDAERGRTQRTWLLGKNSRRSALITQFAAPGGSFAEAFPIGTYQKFDLAFWPSAYPQRALIVARHGGIIPLQGQLPGAETIEAFFAEVSAVLAKQPWRERFLCALCNVVPFYHKAENTWYVCDSAGQALPLSRDDYWQLLALSGGMPVDLAGEWDGETLSPLGILADNQYYII